jgi:hypothetical protein
MRLPSTTGLARLVRYELDRGPATDPSNDRSASIARRWIVALARLPDRAAADLATEGDVFADDKRYAIRINDEFTVDVMPSIAGFSWAGARPKDQMDAAVITEALRRLGKK